MLSVVCFKWKPAKGYRSEFGPQSVNVLRAMVDKNYKRDHKFICITDDPEGIDPRVQVIPLWDDHASVPSPHGSGNPSCYRRLKMFSKEAAEFIGPRFVSVDLDCVITGDMRPVWDREEDFVIWGDTAVGTPYNGSMILMTAGARSQVWEQFDPVSSPARGRELKYIGSDQAWIAACLGPKEAKWTMRDGVVSYRNEIRVRGMRDTLPPKTRIVMFHGQYDPWMPEIQRRHKWVKENWTL